MNSKVFFILLALVVFAQFSMAREIHLLESWKFLNQDVEHAERPDLNDIAWREVMVPHDWAIDSPFDMNIDMQRVLVKEDGENVPKLRTGRTGALPCFGVGWYRTVVPFDIKMKGKRIRVEFDGAMSEAKVFVNGHFVGEWPYGYAYFAFDVTDYWNSDGNNLIAVRLENKPESSRWYPGAGLYRHVRLVADEPVHVAHWGTFVTTPEITKKKAIVHVKTRVVNHTGKEQKIQLTTSILNPNGKVVASHKQTKTLNEEFEFETSLDVRSPELWNVETPVLYKVISKISSSLGDWDGDESTFGIRTIRFDKNEGFFLNGKNIKMKGVCLHHDQGPLGTAVNYRAIQRQLEIMKEMGCNAIRTSHNPPAPELVELCDKMGILLQIEAFDEWKSGKNKNGYHRFFNDWAEKDISAMVLQNRNHPSVVMWSIGNEIREQGQKEGAEIARFLADICRRIDPTRPVTAGFNAHAWAIQNGLAAAVDLVGFNYKPYDYEKRHQENPDFILYGSETASTVSSRGEYKFPAKEKKGAYYSDYHVSSYDMEYPSWASTPDTEFEKQDDCDFIFGEFVWTGFDYLGEPTPYNEGTPARSSYFGIVDLAGMKKDRFYLYQSKWGNQPVLHLLPHWNWEDRIGQNVPVFCYTTYPKAELFVNGVSQGVREKKQNSKYERYRLMWNDIVYQPGEIKVVALDSDDKEVASETIRTSGEAKYIKLTPDRQVIKADNKDLAYVEVDLTDQNGNFCPRAGNMLFVEVTGNARLKALCNGDPTDQTSFASDYMYAFNGKLMVVLQSTGKPGDVSLKVFGSNLKPGEINLRTE